MTQQAVAVKLIGGFVTQSGDPTLMIDGDVTTGWTPYPSTFIGDGDTSAVTYNTVNGSAEIGLVVGGAHEPVIFTVDTHAVPPGVYSCIEFDMGSSVVLSSFNFLTATTTSLGACALYGSNATATNKTNVIQPSDLFLGTFTGDAAAGGMNSPNSNPVSVNIGAVPFRYYRFVPLRPGNGPDGTEIFEFNPLFAAAKQYANSDYDSIWGKGDRIANGLMATTTHGLTGGVNDWIAPDNKGFDNAYASNITINAATFDHPIYLGFRLLNSDASDSYQFLKGILFVTSNSGTPQSTPESTWVIQGGLPDRSILLVESETFVFAQAEIPTGAVGAAIKEYRLEISAGNNPDQIPWPYFEFLAPVDPTGLSSFSSELWVKLAHSPLDGGDRSGGSKHVILTTTLTLHSGALTALMDGLTELPGRDASFQPGSGGTMQWVSTSTAGDYIQWQFPRKVGMQEMVLNVNNPEVLSGGVPTLYGTWQWKGSNDGATFVNVGAPWHFGEGANFALAPNPQPDPNNPVMYLFWRMVLVTGPAFGTGHDIYEFIHNLADPGGQTSIFQTQFTDDSTFTADITTRAPSPFQVKFTDSVDDALTNVVTIDLNVQLSCAFDEDGDFEFFSDIFPSIVTQTVLVISGR